MEPAAKNSYSAERRYCKTESDWRAQVRLGSTNVEPAKARNQDEAIRMRKAIRAVLAASGLAALGAAPAEAVGTR